MIVNDNEEQLSADSFHYMPIDSLNEFISNDEVSELMINMTKTLHMNTPEQTMNGIEFDSFNDNNENKEQLIEQLQAQLVHNQTQRTQTRDYARILCQSNTPAHWYKNSSVTRSVYYYDAKYRKYVPQPSTSLQKTHSNGHPSTSQSVRSQERLMNHTNLAQHNSIGFTPRTKYMLNLYNTAANYHQQRQRSYQKYHPTSPNASRLQPVPTLPSVITTKQRTAPEKQISNHQPIIVESRKKFNETVMPPTA